MTAGGFVNRAFESMLKECSSTKNYPDLQKGIQTYIDCTKVVPQPSKSSDETAQVTDTSAGNESATESDGGAAKLNWISHKHRRESYATGIFSVLLLRFRDSLNGEIGFFFPLIFLRSLDGSECPVNQKINVRRTLEKVCRDPQMLVDVYVNYDCDLEAANLFERMVTTLSKITQGTQTADPSSVAGAQTASIRGSSLQCLLNVLKSLVEWEKLCGDSEKKSKSILSSEEEVSAIESIDAKGKDDASNDFGKAKAHKSTMEAAISEFNRHPVKGMDYLISNKLVENNPASVAQFLRNTPSLNKVENHFCMMLISV